MQGRARITYCIEESSHGGGNGFGEVFRRRGGGGTKRFLR